MGTGADAANLIVFTSSLLLIGFYSFKFHSKQCNIHPIYVQCITVITYSLAAFSNNNHGIVIVNFSDGNREINIQRYLNWIVTCPVIIANLEGLIRSFEPKKQSIEKVTFLIMKDLVLTGFGILAAVQTNLSIKYVLVTASFLIAALLVRELMDAVAENKRRLDEFRAWGPVMAILALFFFSWSLFPVFFILGPPCLNIMSREMDQIGHALADLLAKNLLGLSIWHVRFITLAASYRLMAETSGTRRGSFVERFRGNKHKVYAPRRISGYIPGSISVLLIEARPEMQLLFDYLMREVGIVCKNAFTIEEALKILKRERVRSFGAVLVNVKHFRSLGVERLQKMNVPILAFQFDSDGNGEDFDLDSLLEAAGSVFDGIIVRPLDQRGVAQQIHHWMTVSSQWQETHNGMRLEKKLRLQAPGSPRPTTSNRMHFSFDESHVQQITSPGRKCSIIN